MPVLSDEVPYGKGPKGSLEDLQVCPGKPVSNLRETIHEQEDLSKTCEGLQRDRSKVTDEGKEDSETRVQGD